jgi:hypothetical protein
MASRVWVVLLILSLVAVPIYAATEDRLKTAEDTSKAAGFTQAVITKAISFMPQDLRTKLKDVEKDILTGAKSGQSAKQPTKDACYFVDKEEGGGPSALADQFRAVRKKNAGSPSYSALAPYLGKLAGAVIVLCEPYHTSESALKDKAHVEFEKSLDTNAASLKAEFDGSQKVTNPSDYAVQIAKSANDLLTKAGSSEATTQTETRSSVLTLAANSVADCWWTLLSAEKPKTAADASGDASASPTEGNFIGNTRSLKFHKPDCKYLPAEKNRVYFQTRDEAISQGFVPCKVCKP